MDSLSELLPFLIAAGYLALKFRRRPDRDRTAPVRPKQTRPTSTGTAGPTPFEQLLARLEEQATGAQPAAPSGTRVPEPKREFSRSEPPPVRRVEPPARRAENAMYTESRAAVADYESRAAQATAFRSLEAPRPDPSRGFEHDRHGFGTDNPMSEATFSRARAADQRPANANRMRYDPHGLAPAPAPAAAPRFGSATAIREAFVLSAILGRRPPLRRPSPPADAPKRNAGA